ncbi:MAG: endonuclease/exonuclease/phosphatase family protein, partial [Calditrichia bacterium]|nr:endonuclease/exonuclease/phosphatase family protein [Calditrichia bacterium]
GSQPRIKELAEILSDRTGIGYQYRYEYTHFPWSIWNEGIGILTKYNIMETEGHELPPGFFQRKILRCKVATPAGFINFYSTHLSFGNQESARILQVEEIKNYIASNIIDSTVVMNVVCGDFNAIPDSPPIQMMTQPDNGIAYLDSWAETHPGEDGFTMPSDNPDSRIDYIFVRNQQWGQINDVRLVLDSPNEEGIYTSDHIGVIGELETTNPKSEVTILSPLAGSEVSGEVNIQWNITPTIESDTTIIFISNDNGQSWSEEFRGLTASNSYSWNTLSINDGTQYRLRLIVFRDSLYGFSQLDSSFIINNPGNAAPEVNLIDPAGGEEIQGVYHIRWNAQDADGDILNIDLDVSVDGGSSWNELAWDVENNGIYTWDTRNFSNGNRYRIRLRCDDGTIEVEDESFNFSVANEHPPLEDSLFIHVSGHGSGVFHAHTINEIELTDHLYSISFDDTSFSHTVYNVFDNQTELFVV